MTSDANTLPLTTEIPSEEPMSHRVLTQLARDSAYLLTGLPLAIVTFSLVLTGLALGVGLLITVIGIPVLFVTLELARALALVERRRVEYVTGRTIPTAYRPRAEERGLLRRWWDGLRDAQAWLDALHAILILPLSTLTWSVAVAWWGGAIGGLTYPVWSRALPPDSHDLAYWLRLPVPEWVIQVFIGAVLALTLIPVIRGLTLTQTAFADLLLGNRYVAQLQRQIADLTRQRSATATAEVDALRRLERDLHDGPQQRLVRLQMDLATAERRLAVDDGQGATQFVAEARIQTTEALTELRALTRGIAPPLLADRGLEAALVALGNRSNIPATLELELPDRHSTPVESAAYFVASEALTNVAKHSGATAVTLSAATSEHDLTITVVDNGVGGAALAKGHGLAGLAERIAALGGSLEVDSPPGGPTTVSAVIPCE
ncbi:MAG: sensor histidine kinase [Actinomycetales bacterium]